jgi:hypothetical protein
VANRFIFADTLALNMFTIKGAAMEFTGLEMLAALIAVIVWIMILRSGKHP